MPARILVVDDDQDTLRLLKLILESSGLQPVLAENGRVALDLMAEQMPDLVLCDILMPVMNGYETLTAIRKNPGTKAIPVIMLSALGQERDLQKALAAGADDYIVKPFSLRPLLAKINARLIQAHTPIQ